MNHTIQVSDEGAKKITDMLKINILQYDYWKKNDDSYAAAMSAARYTAVKDVLDALGVAIEIGANSKYMLEF